MCKGNPDGILALPISFKPEQLSSLGQRVRDELTKEGGVMERRNGSAKENGGKKWRNRLKID